MVDWANINFGSPFGNSGESEGRRASVAQREKCNDCEINSKTLNMQAELMTNAYISISENPKSLNLFFLLSIKLH